MDISEAQEKHYQLIESQDFEEKTILECLALIGSEVGEATNECRGASPTDEFPEELADIVPRVFHLAGKCDIDINEAIKKKMKKNLEEGRDENKLK